MPTTPKTWNIECATCKNFARTPDMGDEPARDDQGRPHHPSCPKVQPPTSGIALTQGRGRR